jgi:outer membrane protein TolC
LSTPLRLSAARLAFVMLAALSARAALRPPLDPSRTWTFDDLLAAGRAGNAALAQTRLDVEGLRWERLAALGRLLPSLALSSGYSRFESMSFTGRDPLGRLIEISTGTYSNGTSSDIGLSLNQTLFAGQGNVAAFRRALLAQEDVRGADRQQELQLRHDLMIAGHAVMAAASKSGTELTLLDERRKQLELAQLRLQVGKGTELDVLQMQLDVGRQEVSVESADQELRGAWDRLSLLVGAAPGAPGRVDLPFSVYEPLWDEEELISLALTRRESLGAGRRGLEQARLQSQEARATLLPTLSLQAGHMRREQLSGAQSWDPTPRGYSNSVSLSLSLPLFQGFSNLNGWQAGRISQRRQQIVLERQVQEVRTEIRQALLLLRSSWALSRTTAANLELAERSLALERERYQLGLSSLLQVQSAEAVWHQAESEDLAQRLAFRDRLADLELAAGGSLPAR